MDPRIGTAKKLKTGSESLDSFVMSIPLIFLQFLVFIGIHFSV